MIRTQTFTNPNMYQKWLNENQKYIEVKGEVRRPYRMKTHNGFKKTNVDEITVYYEELKNE